MAGLIVHEWISRIGGSEKVLDAMVDAFPEAAVWCLWNDVPKERYPGRAVGESWLARTPLRQRKAFALPFMPAAWRRVPGDPDWILASSHLFAHHARAAAAPDVPKYAYVYTPARYIWNPELDARGAGAVPRLLAPRIRQLDRRRAAESVAVAVISEFVRERVRQAWGRDAVVIHPPVDVEKIQSVASWCREAPPAAADVLTDLPETFILGASRFIPYKRLDLVIAAGEAAGLPVVIAGGGPCHERLRALAARARVPVTLVLDPPDALLYALYEAATVLVFPAIEDFGIVPVEAMAVGTPVVGMRLGGVSETVVDGLTGALVDPEAPPGELAAAVDRAARADGDACRRRAQLYGRSRFDGALQAWLGASELAPDAAGAV